MERGATTNPVEIINQRARLRPEMAFVAIINTETLAYPDELDWRKKGACTMADAEAFYPGIGQGVKEAKATCARCDEKIKAACLEDALARNEPHGVWGGLTVREREKLVKQRQENDTAA